MIVDLDLCRLSEKLIVNFLCRWKWAKKSEANLEWSFVQMIWLNVKVLRQFYCKLFVLCLNNVLQAKNRNDDLFDHFAGSSQKTPWSGLYWFKFILTVIFFKFILTVIFFQIYFDRYFFKFILTVIFSNLFWPLFFQIYFDRYFFKFILAVIFKCGIFTTLS